MTAPRVRPAPYRETPRRAEHRAAPARELILHGGDVMTLLLISALTVSFSLFAFVVSSRIVVAECAHLGNELSCDVTDSNFLFAKRTRARARDVTEARVEIVYGAKGSKRSRLWFVSDTGRTPITDWYTGDASLQSAAADEVTVLAATTPPARASFRFGSRWYGVAQGAFGLLFTLALFTLGWQRVRVSHSPSEQLVEIERWSPLRRAVSAIALLSEIDGVAVATVPGRRRRVGHRLELVLKDLTRVSVTTTPTSSRVVMKREQRRLASWLGVAAIG